MPLLDELDEQTQKRHLVEGNRFPEPYPEKFHHGIEPVAAVITHAGSSIAVVSATDSIISPSVDHEEAKSALDNSS